MELLRNTKGRYTDEGRRASLERIRVITELPQGAHVHLSGICGTGMAAVAGLLRELGFYVTGSDKAFYPPMGDVVRGLAEKLYHGYSAGNLSAGPDGGPSLVVVGNNLTANNPEVLAVLQNQIPYASMPEVFSALLIGERTHCPCSVVVAGTHGKTTTSAALAVMFERAGFKPGYFIGGVPVDLPSTVRSVLLEQNSSARVVVLEGDEYDSAYFARWPKFHSYRPDILVITSLEFDHADIYNSIIEIEREFTDLAAQVPESGCILVCDVSETLHRLVNFWHADQLIKAPVRFYGECKESDFRLLKREPDLTQGQIGQTIQLRFSEEKVILKTCLTGRHNALNLTAALAVGSMCKLDSAAAIGALEAFHGVKRRQQLLAEIDDILVIEDFAHHPTAVWTTLQGLKESYPNRRLIAAFEPRSNTARRAFFQEDFAFSFSLADVVFVKAIDDAGSFSTTSSTIVALDVKRLAAEISAQGVEAYAVQTFEEMQTGIISAARPGDLIVLMSNGDFGGLPQAIPEELRKELHRIEERGVRPAARRWPKGFDTGE